jgi:hypothetical protein
MGLTVFAGERSTREETGISKNYLTEEELARLNRMVSAFFDLAELRAMRHQPMYMCDWLDELDDFAKRFGHGLLPDAGKASHHEAIEKASAEFEKYRRCTIDEPSAVDCDFLENIKTTQKQLEAKDKGRASMNLLPINKSEYGDILVGHRISRGLLSGLSCLKSIKPYIN